MSLGALIHKESTEISNPKNTKLQKMHIVRAPHLRIHLLDGRVNFIVGGSLAASMNTNIGYDQRSYFQWVQLSLATKDGRQLNTACLLTETFKGTTAAVQQWLWTPSTQVRKLVSDQNSHVRTSRHVKVGMVKNSLTRFITRTG